MPANRILRSLAAVALVSSLTACTTGGLDIGAELEAVPGFAALPDSTDVVPASRPETAAATNPSAPAPSAPGILAAAFAGPTPTAPRAMTAAASPAPASSSSPRLIQPASVGAPRQVAARSAELDALIARYAAHYEVPVELVRRVVHKESTFNPAARNRIYWGLMQIRHDTAQTMGYRGPPEGLLDAETNLNYAVRYLRGAWLTADSDQDQAVRLYQRGYYYDARRKGLLQATGLGRDRQPRG